MGQDSRQPDRKRNVLTRAKAERQIAASTPGELAAREDLAKHPNKHVRAKLARKTACPT